MRLMAIRNGPKLTIFASNSIRVRRGKTQTSIGEWGRIVLKIKIGMGLGNG